MDFTHTGRTALVYKFVLCSTALLLLAVSSLSQNRSKNWYFLYETAGAERGEISELKDRRRVYIYTSLMGLASTDSVDFRRSRLEQQVTQEIEKYGGLEIVKSPEEAEFAINIISFTEVARGIINPEAEKTVDVKFFVLTRGAQRSDGTYAARLVKQSRRTDQGDSTIVVRQETRAFIKELKKVRGEK